MVSISEIPTDLDREEVTEASGVAVEALGVAVEAAWERVGAARAWRVAVGAEA